SEDDLYLIMTAPPDAVVREYQALLKMDGVDLRFDDAGLRAIAQYCLRRRTGARSLRTIVEEICHDVMFEAPERKGETVTVDEASIAAHLDRLGRAVGSTARGTRRSRSCSARATAACSRSSSFRRRPTRADRRWSGRSASWPSC